MMMMLVVVRDGPPRHDDYERVWNGDDYCGDDVALWWMILSVRTVCMEVGHRTTYHHNTVIFVDKDSNCVV